MGTKNEYIQYKTRFWGAIFLGKTSSTPIKCSGPCQSDQIILMNNVGDNSDPSSLDTSKKKHIRQVTGAGAGSAFACPVVPKPPKNKSVEQEPDQVIHKPEIRIVTYFSDTVFGYFGMVLSSTNHLSKYHRKHKRLPYLPSWASLNLRCYRVLSGIISTQHVALFLHVFFPELLCPLNSQCSWKSFVYF